MTSSKISTEKRNRMEGLAVRGKMSEGYNSYLETGGVRFNGKASHSGDRQLAAEGRSMTEPKWSTLTIDQLLAAEKMTLHRISGGESSWRPILERIRLAMKDVLRRAKEK